MEKDLSLYLNTGIMYTGLKMFNFYSYKSANDGDLFNQFQHCKACMYDVRGIGNLFDVYVDNQSYMYRCIAFCQASSIDLVI